MKSVPINEADLFNGEDRGGSQFDIYRQAGYISEAKLVIVEWPPWKRPRGEDSRSSSTMYCSGCSPPFRAPSSLPPPAYLVRLQYKILFQRQRHVRSQRHLPPIVLQQERE